MNKHLPMIPPGLNVQSLSSALPVLAAQRSFSSKFTPISNGATEAILMIFWFT